MESGKSKFPTALPPKETGSIIINEKIMAEAVLIDLNNMGNLILKSK